MNVNGKMMDLEGENMSRIEFDSEAKDKKVIEIALMQAQM